MELLNTSQIFTLGQAPSQWGTSFLTFFTDALIHRIPIVVNQIIVGSIISSRGAPYPHLHIHFRYFLALIRLPRKLGLTCISEPLLRESTASLEASTNVVYSDKNEVC